MVVYLRIDGLDHDDESLDDVLRAAANTVYTDSKLQDHDVDKVVPVLRPENDPRVLESTAVYAHREPVEGCEDRVVCSFGNTAVTDLNTPGSMSTDTADYALIALTQSIAEIGRDDMDDEQWRAFTATLPTGDANPVRVGTLYYDTTSDRVVQVSFTALDERVNTADD